MQNEGLMGNSYVSLQLSSHEIIYFCPQFKTLPFPDKRSVFIACALHDIQPKQK